MTKTFIVNGHEVEFTTCTAIADGETIRQSAVFIHDTTDEFSNGDGVIFCVSVPDSEEEASSLMEEFIETDCRIVESVIF